MRGSPSCPVLLLVAVLGLPGALASAEDAAAPAGDPARATADLVERLKSPDVEVRRQAVAEAKREQAPALTSALARLLADDDEKVRVAAIEALGARTEAAARKDAAGHLASRLPRLARNDQRDERFAALKALHDLAQPSSLKALSDGIGTDVEPEELALRLRAIANLPCDEAIEWLIRFRSGSGRGNRGGRAYWVRMTRDAWIYATGQKQPSNDPDVWRAWWNERKGSWDHKDALARRKAEGGGPVARPTDGAPGSEGR
jgi:hypothetical protein